MPSKLHVLLLLLSLAKCTSIFSPTLSYISRTASSLRSSFLAVFNHGKFICLVLFCRTTCPSFLTPHFLQNWFMNISSFCEYCCNRVCKKLEYLPSIFLQPYSLYSVLSTNILWVSCISAQCCYDSLISKNMLHFHFLIIFSICGH